MARADLGNWETLEFSQDVPGAKTPWRFPAQSVSDGTLRALGVLVALFSGTGDTLSPIGIEEPESALHPAAAGVLLDALRDASDRRQVIVTSHSPDLLDRHDFTLSELRAVRSVAGETKIGQLDKAGALALRDQLYTPGELPPIVAPIVEGHGEVRAVRDLITRIATEICGDWVDVAQPFRLDSGKMRKPEELSKAIRVQAARVSGPGGVLVLRDGDDKRHDVPG